ncbi:unnamed protein product [Xyrichtys novacula]|uniref:Unnamed protein product n=1 Tax=Xyrichtys novacula TaxID=13765 RepID=A0AAV1GEE2_XYRNO|nr:unnamed protein product [Xyrichtys novacula]
MRRRALGRDHLDQRGLNAIWFQHRNNALKEGSSGGPGRRAEAEPIVSFQHSTKGEKKKTQKRGLIQTAVQPREECPSGRHCGFVSHRETKKGPWIDLANNGK